MKNPFEELPDLPSQRRYHRLHLFPWEEATQKVSQFNGVKRPGSDQIPPEPTPTQPEFTSMRRPEGRRAAAGPTQRVSQFNGVRRPERRQVVAEPTPTQPEFTSVKRPEGRQVTAEPTRPLPQFNAVRSPVGRQTIAEPPRRMPPPSSARLPEGRRPLPASPLKLPARMQPIPYKLEPRSAPLRTDDDPELDKLATIPVMVLKNISKQQGSPQPAMKSEISNAASSAAFVSMGNVGGSILKYGGNLVIQRAFGPEGFGLYTLSQSLITLMAAIFHLGLDDAMVRYVSIYRTKWQGGSLRGLAIFCSAVVGVSGMIGALCVFFLAPWLAAIRHSPAVIPLLQLMSPMVPLMTMQIIWINGLQGFKEFRWRVLVQRILIPIILILLLLGTIFLFHPTKDNLQPIALALLINTVIGTVLSLFFFSRKVAGVVKSETEEYRLHDWFGFAVPNFLTSIIDTVLESVDTLLLAYFAVSNAGIGQYAAAIKISGFILMPQASFNAMFAPTIAELHSKGEQQKLEAMFKVVTKWAITFSLPIFGIGTLFSSSLLAISGDRFVSAWPLVIAFCIGTMINVSTGSVGYMLLMTGHQKISFLNSLTAVAVNVVVGVILTPHYGAMGVAIATGMAVSVANLMRLLQVRVLVKMQPYRWDVVKPLLAWLLSSLFTGMLLYLFNLLHLFAVQLFGFHLELCLIPVFLAIYIGLLVLFKVSPEDQVVLDMLRRKFLRGKKNKKNKKR